MEKRFRLTNYEVKELVLSSLRTMIEDNWGPESMVGRCEDIVKALEDGGLVLTEEEDEALDRKYREELRLPV